MEINVAHELQPEESGHPHIQQVRLKPRQYSWLIAAAEAAGVTPARIVRHLLDVDRASARADLVEGEDDERSDLELASYWYRRADGAPDLAAERER